MLLDVLPGIELDHLDTSLLPTHSDVFHFYDFWEFFLDLMDHGVDVGEQQVTQVTPGQELSEQVLAEVSSVLL